MRMLIILLMCGVTAYASEKEVPLGALNDLLNTFPPQKCSAYLNYLLGAECFKKASPEMNDGYKNALIRIVWALSQCKREPVHDETALWKYSGEIILKKIYHEGGYGVTQDKAGALKFPKTETMYDFIYYFLSKYSPDQTIIKELNPEKLHDNLEKLSHLPYLFGGDNWVNQPSVSIRASICIGYIRAFTKYPDLRDLTRAKDYLEVALAEPLYLSPLEYQEIHRALEKIGEIA